MSTVDVNAAAIDKMTEGIDQVDISSKNDNTPEEVKKRVPVVVRRVTVGV